MIEILLSVIVVLLFAILAVLILHLKDQWNIWNAFQLVLEEKDENRKQRHLDISELIESKKYDEALQKVEQRLSIQPENAALIWYKGVIFYYQEKWQLSLEAFKKSEQIEPLYENDLKPYYKVLNEKLS